MKKAIFLLLALVMCLSLCACGGGSDTPETTEAPTETTEPEEVKMSKDEMLNVAVEIDDYRTEMMDNIARAEAKYVGNVYYITGHVGDISNDHLNVSDFTVYLPTEDNRE